MFYPGEEHGFGVDGDFCIGSKGLTLLLFFDVDDKRFVYIHGLVEEGFVVIDHGVGDEGKVVKDLEDYVQEGALVVPFIGIPKFGEVIIGNCVNEEVAEECWHCKGHLVGFLVVLVHRFEFGMAGGHCADQDIRIWAWVMGDDEVVAIAGKVKFILHHESKMSFLSAAIRAGDCQCILVGLLLNFLHAGICRFAITWSEFWEWKTAMEGFCVGTIHASGVRFGH